MGGHENIDNRQKSKDEIFSKSVRAGKRTYFFDVKSTKNEEQYLTITESKKIFDGEGKFHFEKHKIFLYKEDFSKFMDGFTDAMSFIKGSSVGNLNFEENTKGRFFDNDLFDDEDEDDFDEDEDEDLEDEEDFVDEEDEEGK
ncbi:MAG: DUF3276 family protein [Bacteroidales bacterium]|nr:DUF3276 family protein [Bacteroidales bacterium]